VSRAARAETASSTFRIWRLTKARYARTCLDGEGARKAGGRWNERGVAVAYCASTLSLAVLELLVHVDASTIPDDMMAVPITVPDDVRIEDLRPPKGYDTVPVSRAAQRAGSAWVTEGRTLLLRVPSVVVPEEMNVLVNPAHADIARLVVGRARPFRFDPRLVRRA